jgi:hypothetical protein
MKKTALLFGLVVASALALTACGTPACTSATSAAVGLACTANTGVLQFVDPDTQPPAGFPLALYSQDEATVDGNAIGIVAGGSLSSSTPITLTSGSHTVVIVKHFIGSFYPVPVYPDIGPATFTETISTGQTTILTF